MRTKLITTIMTTLFLASIAMIPVKAEPTTIHVWWLEDAERYGGDGTLLSSWTNDRIPPVSPVGHIEFTVTGAASHADMEWFYNYWPLLNFSASPLVVPGGDGRFAAWARYTSPRSGLPILDKIRGNLSIVGSTAYGSYTQYSYIESCDGAAVQEWYPSAVATDDPCVWYGGWTDYTVHGQSTIP